MLYRKNLHELARQHQPNLLYQLQILQEVIVEQHHGLLDHMLFVKMWNKLRHKACNLQLLVQQQMLPHAVQLFLHQMFYLEIFIQINLTLCQMA